MLGVFVWTLKDAVGVVIVVLCIIVACFAPRGGKKS